MDSRFLIVAIRIIWVIAILSLIILFLGATTLILLHILIVSRACRRALSSTVNRDIEGFEAGNGLSIEEIEKIPCFEFSEKKEGGAKVCAVCLESFEVGDLCRMMPSCRHSFHVYCVDCWLVRNPICPICRSNARRRIGGDEVVMSSD